MGFRYGNFFIPMPLQWLKKPPKISLWEEKSCLSRPYSPFKNSIFPLYAYVVSCAKLSKNLERCQNISKRKCTHPITYVGARTQVQSGCTRPFWQGVPCKTSPRWSVVNWNLEMYLLQVVARTMLPKRNRLPVTYLRNRGQIGRFWMILSESEWPLGNLRSNWNHSEPSVCSSNKIRSTLHWPTKISSNRALTLPRQKPNDPDFAMNLIFLSIQCLTKAKVAIYNSLKIASQETLPSFYECSPLLGVFCV